VDAVSLHQRHLTNLLGQRHMSEATSLSSTSKLTLLTA
jgi:hypothetical protein